MVKIETMENGKIYELASALISSFEGDITLPVKVNFYLQKNITKIVDLGKEIEKSRMEILEKYGTLDEEKQQYSFSKENAEIVTSELKDLMELTQDVEINAIDLEAFKDAELTGKQMAAISFMINEEE